VAAGLPKSEAAAVLQEALEAARAAPTRLDPPNRLDVLRAIAACPLPEALAGGAVAIAKEIESADDRAAALAMLAPALPAGHRRAVLDEALEAASTVIALAHVLPALPVDERTRLAADALERIVRVQEWQGEEYVTVTVPSNLLALAPHLSADQAASAFRAAPRIDDPEERAAVLAALAPRVEDSARAGCWPQPAKRSSRSTASGIARMPSSCSGPTCRPVSSATRCESTASAGTND
jgi:hypothetical protein